MGRVYTATTVHLLLLLMASGVSLGFLTAKVPKHVRKGSITMESAGRVRRIGISMSVPALANNYEARLGSLYHAFESPPLDTVYSNLSLGYNRKVDSVIAVQGGELPPSNIFKNVIVSDLIGEKGNEAGLTHCQQMGLLYVCVKNPPPPPIATIRIMSRG